MFQRLHAVAAEVMRGRFQMAPGSVQVGDRRMDFRLPLLPLRRRGRDRRRCFLSIINCSSTLLALLRSSQMLDGTMGCLHRLTLLSAKIVAGFFHVMHGCFEGLDRLMDGWTTTRHWNGQGCRHRSG